MNLLPVIVRELRAQSRQPMTFWLRVIGLGAIIGVMALVDLSGAPSELGGRLFSALNATLFLSIWIFVPLLTADTISREKREGTLGLLFLTPLTPIGIVLGKSLIHAVRAITLFLAVLPALALPFLLGGLTWKDCVVSLFASNHYASETSYRQVFDFVLPLFFVSSFFLLPEIGLCFSLQRLHFVGAWLLTCATGLLVPALSGWWMNRNLVLA